MTIDTSPIGIIKALSYGIIAPVFAYTGLSHELVLVLAVLIGVDIFTAMIREFLLSNLNSKTLGIGIMSKVVLMIIPFVLVLAGKGAYIDMTPIATLSLSVLVLAECYSILGNITQIRKNDKSITEQDAITFVLRKAQDIIKNILGSLMDGNKNENKKVKEDQLL